MRTRHFVHVKQKTSDKQQQQQQLQHGSTAEQKIDCDKLIK